MKHFSLFDSQENRCAYKTTTRLKILTIILAQTLSDMFITAGFTHVVKRMCIPPKSGRGDRFFQLYLAAVLAYTQPSTFRQMAGNREDL